MAGVYLFFVISFISGMVWSSVKSQSSEDDPMTDKRIGLPYVIVTSVIILIMCCILFTIFIILVICIVRQKRQQRLNNEKSTSVSCNEVNKLQKNPAYAIISDKSASNEIIKLQGKTTNSAICHTSSGFHMYEEILFAKTPTTSSNSGTSDSTIKMERNPAYHI